MTCAEFQSALAVDDLVRMEALEHPRTCVTCGDLVADLRSIATAVTSLRAEEPSEIVWHRITESLGITSTAATMSHRAMADRSVEAPHH
jgi:hypothetical protein